MADTSSFQLTNDDLEFVRTLVHDYGRAVARNEITVGDQHAQDDEYAYTQELILKLMTQKSA